MHSRRVRANKKLLLQTVPAPPKAPAKNFTTPNINAGLRLQQWFESILRSQHSFCGCGDPVLHFTKIATRFNYLPTTPSPPDPPAPTPQGRPALRRLPALPPAPAAPPRDPVWPKRSEGGAGGRGPAGEGSAAVEADKREEEPNQLQAALAEEANQR
uniref:ORF2 n=1 Tax=Torque teno virus TaxID=68887 RepID=A0A6B7HED3_9VIRU|nr:ORF2 [Torque teno virus]